MAGVNRILTNLLSCIDNRDFYQSHQVIRTLSYSEDYMEYGRYLGKDKIEESHQLLFNGAEFLLLHKQYEGGADLSFLLVDMFKDREVSFSPRILSELNTLAQLLKDTEHEREAFMISCLKYSASVEHLHCSTTADSPSKQLNRRFAILYWNEKSYLKARTYFLRSNDADGLAGLLIELQLKKGFSYEVDMFIFIAVLQLLCSNTLTMARKTYDMYVAEHPHTDNTNWPLINLADMILTCVESKSTDMFKKLVEKYQKHLKVDPSYNKYLQQIGEKYLSIPKPKSSNFIGNFISNLFSGDGTPSTSSAATPNPTNRATTSEEEDLADYGPVEDTPPSSPRPGAPQELDLD